MIERKREKEGERGKKREIWPEWKKEIERENVRIDGQSKNEFEKERERE